MQPYADMGCLLKVNTRCEACNWKVMEVLSSICGVYSVTIDAAQGTAKVSGKVNPNLLLGALARSGNHAELVWVKLQSPAPTKGYYYDDEYDSHAYGAVEQSYQYQNENGLPERSWYEMHQGYRPPRRLLTEYPRYNTDYYRHLQPARYVPGLPPQAVDPYEYDEPIDSCRVM